MSIQVNPKFLGKLRSYGAFDIDACFNCGNCTAVCPLSTGDDTFPRRLIRYGQLGALDRLVSSKELWLCYYCGECSDTCPRQAEPGEYMAAARRYAIAASDPTGIARLLYTSKPLAVLLLLVLTALLTGFLLSRSGPMEQSSPALFSYLSFDLIHDLGLIVIGLALLATFVGIIRMTRRMLGAVPKRDRNEATGKPGTIARLRRGASEVITEIAAQKRYRDCQQDQPAPWYRNRWFIHWAIMWGFVGLLAATIIDYVLVIAVNKIPGQPDPIWYPPRLLGTVAGLSLMYGTTVALVSRVGCRDKYSSHSLLSDWLLLGLLFLAGLTGFLVELAVYLPTGSTWGYILFLVHVVLGMEVVVLLPFTKFAHAIYRPLALLIHNVARAKC
jgi:ferredoxin